MPFRIPDYYPSGSSGTATRSGSSGNTSRTGNIRPKTKLVVTPSGGQGVKATSAGAKEASNPVNTGKREAPRAQPKERANPVTASKKEAPRAVVSPPPSPTIGSIYTAPAPKTISTTATTAPTAPVPVAPEPPDPLDGYVPAKAPSVGDVFSLDATPTDTSQPQTITIPDAKVDATYQQQVAMLAKALANYQAQQNLALKQYGQNFDSNLRDLGFNQANNSWDQRGPGAYGQTFQANEGDFAGRGAYNSGQYIKANSDLTDAYNRQQAQMQQAKNQYEDTLNLSGTQYDEQNTLDQQAALANAVARIAAQYGVQGAQVPQGTGPKTITKPTLGGVTS